MRKVSALFLIMVALLLNSSCKKETSSQSQNSTAGLPVTTLNLKPDPTAVTLSVAKELALHFLQAKNPTVSITIKSAETVVKNDTTYFHIINANKGFVILSADSVYAPILAYDSAGNFDKNNLNPGLVLWMSKHAHELNFMRNTNTAYKDSIATANKTLWQALGSNEDTTMQSRPTAGIDGGAYNVSTLIYSNPTTSTIGPLCATYWDQRDGFNLYCPVGTNGPDPTGCDPTAMAQVMYFWSKPTKYNWSIMPLKPFQGLASGLDQVAQLMYDIGTTNTGSGQFTTYGNTASSSNPYLIPTVLVSFGYSSQITGDGHSNSGTGFASLLSNEILTNIRPCILSGWPSEVNNFLGLVYSASGEGHTWVCDGVQTSTGIITNHTVYYNADGVIISTTNRSAGTYSLSTLLHMNWGWGPNSTYLGGTNNDGWYNDAIDYTTGNNGNGNVDYQYFQTVVYKIHP